MGAQVAHPAKWSQPVLDAIGTLASSGTFLGAMVLDLPTPWIGMVPSGTMQRASRPRPACAICGNPVKRLTNVYCGRPCRDEGLRRAGGNGGTFRSGNLTNLQPVGTVSVRRRHGRGGEPRAWVKVSEHPNVWRLRAVVVWEAAHGPLPRGRLVHHRDRDTLNDALENLEATTRADHLLEHRPEFEEKRVAAATKARWGR